MTWNDHIFVVSGSSSGIGKHLCEKLLLGGARVTGVSRDINNLSTAFRESISTGKFLPVQADLRFPKDCENIFDATVELWGSIDGIVNCAGTWVYGDASSISSGEWTEALNQNLTTAFLMNKFGIAKMIKLGSRGSIVNISSALALVGMNEAVAYSCSKAGLIQMTRNLAIDYGQYGIRINCVCPGLVDTPMTSNVFSNEEWVEKIVKRYPLGRLGLPADVTPLIEFLLSEQSSWITGVAIPLDGGFSICSSIPDL